MTTATLMASENQILVFSSPGGGKGYANGQIIARPVDHRLACFGCTSVLEGKTLIVSPISGCETLVRNTLPVGNIRAMTRVSIVISGESAYQSAPSCKYGSVPGGARQLASLPTPWPRPQGLKLAVKSDHSFLGGLRIKRRPQQVHCELLQAIPLALEV